MLESELQRQKRERNFQQRVLNAVEAPKRNRFLAVINSAFFLWCISALFLTVGGGYLTNHQQCVREADQLIERRSLLTQELYGRQLAFSRCYSACNIDPLSRGIGVQN